jgi:hypothetical protein
VSHLTHAGAVGHGVFLPAEHAGDVRADLEIGMARRHHLADGEGAHHAAKRHRLGVVGHRRHPAAHGGLDAEVMVAHQEFAIRQPRHRRLGKGEVLGLRDAGRP